jgi:hypothetical protein
MTTTVESDRGVISLRRLNVRAYATNHALSDLSTHVTAQGGLGVNSMPVFKSGTFKDSMGDQFTWKPEHMDQMVFNFQMLKDRGVLPNIPVRDGHRSAFGSGGALIGYVSDLRHDVDTGKLVADYEITEPTAIGKLQRGTYRARSAEVGLYETNDEAVYWPVFLGFAFVDIPAVEGLYEHRQANETQYSLMSQEDIVTVPDPQQPGAPTPPAPTPNPTAPAPAPNPAPQPVPAPTPAPGGPATASFSLNGHAESDFAAVQAHIAKLEGFVRETTDTNRKNFVSKLAADKKITQPQVDLLTPVVLTMDEKQYGDFAKAYEDAPIVPVLAPHAGAAGDGDADPRVDRIAVLQAQVQMHRRSGVPEEQIAKMPSAMELVSLTSARN